ncbi:MAG: alginate lyase family protein [Thermomicrobiales bacterium]
MATGDNTRAAWPGEPAPDVTGPRLSDTDFFTKVVDSTQPGLAELPALAARGDFATARQRFAAEVRRTLQPERFLRARRTFEGTHFMYPGETTAEAAERILRLELISCGTPHQFTGEVDWYANPTFNQYKEWTWQLSRHPEWAILAARYRETGDERYAAAFVRFFQSWVRQAPVPEDASGNATRCWRTIETGIRMGGSWQWALHSFYRSPHFTDDVLVDWYKSVWEHGWRLRNFHRTHNWLIMEMNGLGQIGLLYPQFRDAPAWRAYAFDRLVQELGSQVYPDGFQFELSTGYHQVVVRNYEWLWEVYDAFNEPVPAAFRAGLEPLHAANVRLMMPDGRLPDLNDGGWHAVAPLLRRAVNLYPERADFRWAASDRREGTPPAETSLAFPYAGYYVSRTGWEPDAVWVFFDGGPFGFAHQHEDKLNLLLHAYGRLLLTEGGNYAYDASEMRRYVLSTRSHNTVRVDGQDQNRRKHFNQAAAGDLIQQPAGARWHATARYDSAEATYDEGYGPDASRTATHQRRVICLKTGLAGLGACVLVVDRLTPHDGAAHEYTALWHFAGDQVETDGLTARGVDTDQPNLTILAAGPADLRLTLVSGQETPEWQGWRSTGQHQQGEYAPAPAASYAWTANAPSRVVTLLYPTRAGATCPVQSLTAAPDAAVTTIQLQLADGRQLDLDEQEYFGATA